MTDLTDIVDMSLVCATLLGVIYMRFSLAVAVAACVAWLVATLVIKFRPLFALILISSVIVSEFVISERILRDSSWQKKAIGVAALATCLTVLVIFGITGVFSPRVVAIIIMALYFLHVRFATFAKANMIETVNESASLLPSASAGGNARGGGNTANRGATSSLPPAAPRGGNTPDSLFARFVELGSPSTFSTPPAPTPAQAA
jgi:hypothetical protein